MRPENKNQRKVMSDQQTGARITEAFNTIDVADDERKADETEAWRLANELTKIVPRPPTNPHLPAEVPCDGSSDHPDNHSDARQKQESSHSAPQDNCAEFLAPPCCAFEA